MSDKKSAYIVCGPESSGNRALAALFVNAGCWGEGSTNQPAGPNWVPDVPSSVVIVHTGVDGWIRRLQERGFAVTCLVLIREPHAQASSAVLRGHCATRDDALAERNAVIATNIAAAVNTEAGLEILTYEGLHRESAAKLLERLGLDPSAAESPLALIGQAAPPDEFDPARANRKHY